ncbi:hypothetical protein MANI_024569 [Metarhizium anisopliae]|nr:hypothetical protein MANI_024569 [Metarhizium anisopliae]
MASTCKASISSSYTTQVHTAFQKFCEDRPIAERATVDDILYAGNLGANGDYGCNLMLVDDSIANQYQYIINMTNSASKSQACVCWLKIGPNGGVGGFFLGNEVLDFTLPPGGHSVLAADQNTIGGCTCSLGAAVQLTGIKQFASTWLEFEMATKHDGWSGADASCLVAAKSGLDIPGLQVCSQYNVCSTVYAGVTGDNAYLQGMEDVDGIGIVQQPGEVRLRAIFGYQT